MSELPSGENLALPSFTKTWHSEPYPFIDPTRPELSAEGKNIVITGGGTGIGNAIGVAFAKAGAKSVVIMGRRLEKLEAGKASIAAAASDKTTVFYERVDLVDKQKTVDAFDSVAKKVGKIDVLVVNAAVYGQAGNMTTISASNLVETFELNVATVLNTFQAFLPHAAVDAALLHSSTLMAHIAPMNGSGVYPVTKAASLKLVDYIASENPQLRVISCQPAWTPTELNGNLHTAPDSGKNSFPDRAEMWHSHMKIKIPLIFANS